MYITRGYVITPFYYYCNLVVVWGGACCSLLYPYNILLTCSCQYVFITHLILKYKIFTKSTNGEKCTLKLVLLALFQFCMLYYLLHRIEQYVSGFYVTYCFQDCIAKTSVCQSAGTAKISVISYCSFSDLSQRKRAQHRINTSKIRTLSL